jgi:membrane protein YdbS with pleckstrin-like domain
MIPRYKLLITAAMILNYTAILTSLVIWRNNIMAYCIAVLASLSIGLALKSIEDLIVLSMLAYIIAAFTAVFIIISPTLLLQSSREQIEMGFLGISGTIIFNSFLIIPLSIISALIGRFISDSLPANSKNLSLD